MTRPQITTLYAATTINDAPGHNAILSPFQTAANLHTHDPGDTTNGYGGGIPQWGPSNSVYATFGPAGGSWGGLSAAIPPDTTQTAIAPNTAITAAMGQAAELQAIRGAINALLGVAVTTAWGTTPPPSTTALIHASPGSADSGFINVTGNITSAAQIISTVATGTAPLTISSTTKVANLNADRVDGFSATGTYGSGTFASQLLALNGSGLYDAAAVAKSSGLATNIGVPATIDDDLSNLRYQLAQWSTAAGAGGTWNAPPSSLLQGLQINGGTALNGVVNVAGGTGILVSQTGQNANISFTGAAPASGDSITYSDFFSSTVTAGLGVTGAGNALTAGCVVGNGTAYIVGTGGNSRRTAATGPFTITNGTTPLLTASRDCYIDWNGTDALTGFTVSAVANGATAPSQAAGTVRLAKVVTGTTTITGITDLRYFSLGAVRPVWFNAVDFGAVDVSGNFSGGVDSTAAINAAGARASASSPAGGVVYLSAGVFKMSPSGTNGLTLYSNVKYVGAGTGQTTLRVANGVGDFLALFAATTAITNVSLEHMTLDGNAQNNTAANIAAGGNASQYVIHSTGGITGLTVDHVVSKNWGSVRQVNIIGTGNNSIRVTNSYFHFWLNTAKGDYDNSVVYVTGQNSVVTSNVFETSIVKQAATSAGSALGKSTGGRTAIEIIGGPAVVADNTAINFRVGCFITPIMGSTGIQGDTGSTAISGNVFKGCNDGISIWNSYQLGNVSVIGNVVECSQVEHNLKYSHGIYFPNDPIANPGSSSTVVITGNTVSFQDEGMLGRTNGYDSSGTWAAINPADSYAIGGMGSGNITGLVIADNTIANAPAYAIALGKVNGPVTRNVRVANNIIVDAGRNAALNVANRIGLYLSGTMYDVQAAGNQITDTNTLQPATRGLTSSQSGSTAGSLITAPGQSVNFKGAAAGIPAIWNGQAVTITAVNTATDTLTVSGMASYPGDGSVITQDGICMVAGTATFAAATTYYTAYDQADGGGRTPISYPVGFNPGTTNQLVMSISLWNTSLTNIGVYCDVSAAAPKRVGTIALSYSAPNWTVGTITYDGTSVGLSATVQGTTTSAVLIVTMTGPAVGSSTTPVLTNGTTGVNTTRLGYFIKTDSSPAAYTRVYVEKNYVSAFGTAPAGNGTTNVLIQNGVNGGGVGETWTDATGALAAQMDVGGNLSTKGYATIGYSGATTQGVPAYITAATGYTGRILDVQLPNRGGTIANVSWDGTNSTVTLQANIHQIATSTAQKVGFFAATPVVRPSVSGAVTSITDANAKAAIQSIIAALGDAAGALGLFHNATT